MLDYSTVSNAWFFQASFTYVRILIVLPGGATSKCRGSARLCASEVSEHQEAIVDLRDCSCDNMHSGTSLQRNENFKNYLRSRTSDIRLTGQALMYVHPETDIDIEEVINRFASVKKRRLDFIL